MKQNIIEINNNIDYLIKVVLNNIKNLSIANKRKVAALLVNLTNYNVLSTGFNHNKFAGNNCENSLGNTLDTVIHAEADCIMNIFNDISLMQYINDCYNEENEISMFVTFSPCIECSKLIVQFGKIKNLFIIEEHSHNFRNSIEPESLSALDFLINNGIDVYLYNKENNSFVKIVKDNIKIGVYHSKDLDGYMSGLLFEKYLVNKENNFGYNRESDAEWINVVNDLVINKLQQLTIYFGDISPEKEWLNNNLENIKSGKIKLIILDHHNSSLNYLDNFITENKLNSNNIDITHTKINNNLLDYYSGCEIVLKYLSSFNFPISVKYINLCKLIGSYDVFRFKESFFCYDTVTKNFDYFINLIAYLKFNYRNYESFVIMVDNLGDYQQELNKFSIIGKLINDNGRKELKKKLEKGLFRKLRVENENFQYINIVEDFYPEWYNLETIKQFHKEKTKNQEFNNQNNYIYISYEINLEKNEMTYSVRSYIQDETIPYKQAIDIAKEYNGGGHNDAAGFKTTIEEGFELLDFYKNYTLSI